MASRSVAALVNVNDVATLETLRAAEPQQGLASIAGGWAGSDQLVESIASAARRGRRRPGRLE